ncbi:putative membrane protein [Xanthomonas arboricola]|nr:putative membrane protein [Xanthomonas arboricola]
MLFESIALGHDALNQGHEDSASEQPSRREDSASPRSSRGSWQHRGTFHHAPNESAMNSTATPARSWAIHPFHAAVLGGVWPLFLGALLSDYAYWSSHQIQWANFAAWLLIGAMVLTTIALLCAIVGFVRGSRNVIYVIALGAAWIVGFFDALHHARDAWAIMPAALVFSAIATAFALVATWSGLSSLRVGGAR